MHRFALLRAGSALFALGALSGIASADIIFSSRGTGPASGFSDAAVGNREIVEDGTFNIAGPLKIASINLGYDNQGVTSVNVDALVTFYDDMSYAATPPTSPIASNAVGTQYRLNFTAVAGPGETGLLSLTGGPLDFPDSTFGVDVRFVFPNTTTSVPNMWMLFHDDPVTVGSSNAFFGTDLNSDGGITRTEAVTWEDEPDFPPAQYFMEIATPEPASLSVLGLLAVGMLRRRRDAR